MSSQSASGGSKTTYPYKSPPPIAAIQHSRSVLALTALRAFADEIDIEKTSPGLSAHIKKILDLLDVCAKDLQNRKLSAGARRDLDKSFRVLAESGCIGTHSNSDDIFYFWGVGMWCAMTLLDDCESTCPAYFNTKTWKKLSNAVEELCVALEKIDDRIGVDGFKLYERVCICV